MNTEGIAAGEAEPGNLMMRPVGFGSYTPAVVMRVEHLHLTGQVAIDWCFTNNRTSSIETERITVAMTAVLYRAAH